jgi:hypothetical protein
VLSKPDVFERWRVTGQALDVKIEHEDEGGKKSG